MAISAEFFSSKLAAVRCDHHFSIYTKIKKCSFMQNRNVTEEASVRIAETTPHRLDMKRNVCRLLFMLAVMIVILGAGVVLVIYFGRKAAQATLPNPNGYDNLLQAGQAVIGKIDDAPDLDHDRLHALVATNAEALRLLRLCLSHRCAVPTGDQIANFANVSRDLMGLKSLARVLSAEGRLAEMENRPADAARSYVDAIRLGSEMSHGGLMMNRLVGIACEGVGSISFVKFLPKLNCAQTRPLIADLEKIDDTTVRWGEVLQNENRFVRPQLGNYPNPIKLVSGLWQARDMRTASAERHALAAAHLRLLIVELALRAYRCDEGVWMMAASRWARLFRTIT